MKHIISYSGGIGSYMSSVRVIEKYGIEDTLLVFTDTMNEDIDLYRFLIETASSFENVDVDDLIQYAKSIPNIEDGREIMLEMIKNLCQMSNQRFQHFIWLQYGKDIWQLFKDKRLIGNGFVGACTYNLKKVTFRKWLESNYSSDECIIYLGMYWTEAHRHDRAVLHWKPYKVESPMCEKPFLDKEDMLEYLEKEKKIKEALSL